MAHGAAPIVTTAMLALGLLGANGATAAIDPARAQTVFERLCAGVALASEATCAGMRRDIDAARQAQLDPVGATLSNLTRGEFVGPATIYRFEWDPAARRLKMFSYHPGITAPDSDVYDVTETAEKGSFSGRRTMMGAKYRIGIKVSPEQLEVLPYKIGWGQGWIREWVGLVGKDGLSVDAAQRKEAEWTKLEPETRRVTTHRRMEGAALADAKAPMQSEGARQYAEATRQLIERERQAKAQRAADRAETFGLLAQGVLIAGQAYASGMQEANDANARSQAIIDAAAESDRQYRAAQRATELARQVAPQFNSSPPPPRAQPSTRPAAPPAVRAAPTTPAASKPSAVPGTGSNPPVHLYCYRWIEARTGERTSYVSQVGAVPKTAPNPEIESRTVARWSDYLDAQGIGTSGIVGCRLDTDRTYNAQNRSAFIGTARSRPKDTLHELAWSPS